MPGGVVTLQQGKMLLPGHIILLHNFGMLKLKEDVIKIGTERLTEESFHIFKYECLGLCLSDGSDSFREHISCVIICLVLTAQGERLAWRTSGYKLNFARVAIVAYGTDIGLEYRPVLHTGISVCDIVIYIITGVFIPLKKSLVRKACLVQSECKTTRSAEKFY